MPTEFSAALDASAQSAYAELLEVTRRQDLERSVGSLSGSFNRKRVKNATYWYYQYTEGGGGGTRQVFVGPDDDKVRALVEKSRSREGRNLEALAKAAITLGCSTTTPAHFRIIRRLNEIGFFRAGGVLVGTHAFLAAGNLLGVAWGDLSRTQDIDFAHAGNDISLALPTTLSIETRSALESLEAGFLPVPGFRPNDKTATFKSRIDKTLRVDFLAPAVGARRSVFRHEGLGVNLQPLAFMEYLLEDVDQAAVLSALGSVLVNVPDPARYALHKLLVYAERLGSNPLKANKDLRQAAALVELLGEDRRDAVLRLWQDLLDRGPGWRTRARKGLAGLKTLAPGLALLPELARPLAR